MKEFGVFSHQARIDTDGTKPVAILADQTGLTKQKIKLAMKQGAVWVAHKGKPRRLRRAQTELVAGDRLFLYFNEQILSTIPPRPLLVADEHDYSIWYKPPGLFSQGSKWGDHCSIARWVEQNHVGQRRTFLIHRLDRAARGLMLLGHTKAATSALAALFAHRKIEKHYRAVVSGIFEPNRMPHTVEQKIEGQSATTHLTLLKTDGHQQRSLLDIQIETGRKHQIRRHLQSIGLPIVGDRLHGHANSGEDLQLAAYHLSFRCPLSGQPKAYTLDAEFVPNL